MKRLTQSGSEGVVVRVEGDLSSPSERVSDIVGGGEMGGRGGEGVLRQLRQK